MHCLVRGQTPEDYEILVVSRPSLFHDIAERAHQLLTAGRALGAGVKISRRERDVLDGVLKNLANKEIAAKLNVAERTVKFHVSSLLAKFGVTDRTALSREVSLGRIPTIDPPTQAAPNTFLFGYSVRSEAEAPREFPAATESPRGRSRVLPMYRNQRFAT